MKTTPRGLRRLLRAAKAHKGFSSDKRRRRRQHRQAAAQVLRDRGVFSDNGPGTIAWGVAQWHLSMARHFGR
jgi:hypothetical protein